MEMLFENVFVIGTGLIGTSLGLSMKDTGEVGKVKGYDSNTQHVMKALEIGGIDDVGQLQDVGTCDLAVLAVPVESAKSVLEKILPFLKDGTTVTDVGSTKREMMKTFDMLYRKLCQTRKFEKDINFIGGHPMAGSEKSGPDGARGDLFKGKTYVLVRDKNCSDDAFEKFKALVLKFGALPMEMEAETHDLIVSATSHLPQVVSYLLVQTLMDYAKTDDSYLKLVGSGFRDTTRLASSAPAMWIDIFKQNRDNIMDVLTHFQTQIEWFKGMLEAGRYEELSEKLEKIVMFKEHL
ncbi:MAG TPA: prephenate dehydrogenase/arogenate dehydrogenase family protein [Fervidobacterium sp.]|nr:prephenate dehydrogenase/arogenate dehydrogenase family protein [Fervidobacterium sp.]HOM73985.1 prephenate dehydrogenase/arogenate dehydrogenase family protein [Fervidobacterium sp.]HPP17714.1 prephenate dehydrogenase/arogenate dehydrogenase family protein [Fervidobacterium sp.]HRD20083.1 prephenate dehydrogenase/arogenate dehydrogenase family protein [Fervidobacterium sp.]